MTQRNKYSSPKMFNPSNEDPKLINDVAKQLNQDKVKGIREKVKTYPEQPEFLGNYNDEPEAEYK